MRNDGRSAEDVERVRQLAAELGFELQAGMEPGFDFVDAGGNVHAFNNLDEVEQWLLTRVASKRFIDDHVAQGKLVRLPGGRIIEAKPQ